MCKEQYTIGVDYGSLSARGVLVRVRDGEIAAEAEFAAPNSSSPIQMQRSQKAAASYRASARFPRTPK